MVQAEIGTYTVGDMTVAYRQSDGENPSALRRGAPRALGRARRPAEVALEGAGVRIVTKSEPIETDQGDSET